MNKRDKKMENLYIYFDEYGNIFQSDREPNKTEIQEWEDGVLDIVKVTFCDNEKVLEVERIDGTEIEEKEIIENEIEDGIEKDIDFEEEEDNSGDLEQNEN